MVVRRERLILRQRVHEDSQIPEEMLLRRVTEPLDAVGKNRYGGVIDRRPLHRPTRVTDHDLVEREALLRTADEDVSRQPRNGNHDSCFADQKILRRCGVVHDSAAPRDTPVRSETTLEYESRVPDLCLGEQRELLLA